MLSMLHLATWKQEFEPKELTALLTVEMKEIR